MNAQVIFISGGTKGIGLEAVHRFHALGYKIVTCARNPATWQTVLVQRPELGDVDFQQVDLSVDSEAVGLFRYISTHYGSLNIAINNASPKLTWARRFNTVGCT